MIFYNFFLIVIYFILFANASLVNTTLALLIPDAYQLVDFVIDLEKISEKGGGKCAKRVYDAVLDMLPKQAACGPAEFLQQ